MRDPDPGSYPGEVSQGTQHPSSTRPAELLGPNYSLAVGPTPRTRRPFPHLPALDGLRGLAVVAVLCFHGDWRWAAGGFLGVSTFFTLSGYLITARLVHDFGETGTVDLRAFWERRIRRLLPAAVTTVAVVVILAATMASVFREHLAGDVVGALTNMANWRFWAAQRSYASLFATQSPLLHFWSLAIEEQFYLVFPLLAWLVLVKLRAKRAVFGLVVVVLAIAASVGSTLAGLAGKSTLVYYATPLRAAEILMGCALALVPLGRPAQRWSSAYGRYVPMMALSACVLLWVATTKDMRWLDRGGLPAYSLLSAAVVLGCVRVGPVQRILSLRPLRWLGSISYGLYLYHWPLFLLFNQRRVRLEAGPRFALQVGVSVGAALLSYHLLERPILHGDRPGWVQHRRIGMPLVAGMAAVLATSILVDGPGGVAAAGGFPPSVEATRKRLSATTRSTRPPEPTRAPAGDTTVLPTTDVPLAAAANVAGTVVTPATEATTVPTTEVTSVPTTPAPPTTREPVPLLRVAAFGDSTALLTGGGLDTWGQETRTLQVDIQGTALGCGIVRGGKYRVPGFGEGPQREECNNWAQRWTKVLDGQPADVSVVLVGTWDVTDHQLPGDTQWRAPGDPIYDAYLKRDMLAAVDELSTKSPVVVWLTCPLIDFGLKENGISPRHPMSDPARMVRFNQLLGEVANERANLRIVDLAGFLAQSPGGELDRIMRPDGVHFTDQAALQVANWLGPELLSIAAEKLAR